jgi:chromosome segregation ATPase
MAGHPTFPGEDMDQAPELQRALFGYRKQDVESILEARERMFEQISEEANQRKEEAERLRRDVEKARAETRTAREEMQRVRGELDAEVNDVRQELETLRADLPRMEERRREAETRATGLEAEVREARREIAGLNERLRLADATEIDLRTRLEEASTAAPQTRELGAVVEATQQAIARIMAGAKRDAEEDLSRVQRTRNEIQADVDRVRVWRERIEPVTHDVSSEIAVAQAQMSQTAERVGEALRPMSDALTALSKHLDELARVAVAPTGRPDRVDLVSHEQEQDQEQDAPASVREAPAETTLPADPWSNPWR